MAWRGPRDRATQQRSSSPEARLCGRAWTGDRVADLNSDRAQRKLFGYSEPTLRLPIVIAILAGAPAIPTLILLILHDSRIAGAQHPSTFDCSAQPPAPTATRS